jgi:predicted amidohydrolase
MSTRPPEAPTAAETEAPTAAETEAPTAAETAVAVAQFAPTDDPLGNLASIRALVATAASRGAKLVLFPEYSSVFFPELGPRLVEAAEPVDGPFVAGLAAAASEYQVHIVAGMVEAIAETARFSNTLVAVAPDGRLVATYRKLHLYDAFGATESEWVKPGDILPPEIFEVGGFSVGLQTCYDLRFPEVTRRLADAGATLVLVPSEWVHGPLKEHHWRTLITARALENTVFVAAADHIPPVGVGNSMIVDPMGVEVATIGEAAGVAVAVIAPARVAQVRVVNPALALRRFRVVAR